ncbi:hypothetical protein [Catenulispora subtropica]|uniref:Uncharacterized protein n=1 Tax=Catenulispora subtropica TaxID=450798 RepID=A0ABP5CWQ5_9ACTN
MDSVAPSGLPIHKTADLGAGSRVYQAIAKQYKPVLTDLSATGYGDAESNATSIIVVLGQLRPTPPLPNVVDGTLSALGATGIVAQEKFGAHAMRYSLVMSCGMLPTKYTLCVWTGGTHGNLFLGAVEGPVGMSVADTAALAESVFGYVAP